MKRRQLLSIAAATAATSLASRAWAQAKPAQPLRLIVPFVAGGPIDVTARIVAEAVREDLGPVVVENRPGVGGNLGMDEVARAAPDGRTLGLASVATHAINPWLYPKLPFDAATQFAPITNMVRTPNVLVVNAEYARLAHINSVADLIAWARQRPGQLSFGSSGTGSSGHLAAEVLKNQAHFYAAHIPFRGSVPVQQALLSGEVDFSIDNLAAAWPHIRAGRIKPLAITSLQRSTALPGVPTLAETVPGFAIESWWGLVGPRGMSVEQVYAFNEVFTRALKSPAVRERFAAMSLTPAPSSPQEFAAFLQEQRTRYRDIVRSSGAKPD